MTNANATPPADPPPRILIVVEGGLVRNIISDRPVLVLIKDFDCMRDDLGHAFDPDGFHEPDQVLADSAAFRAAVREGLDGFARCPHGKR